MPPKKKTTKPKANERYAVLNTEEVAIRDLNFYHKNPNVNPDIDKIAKSLHVNGLFRPVVVNIGTHTNRPMEILAGNHTVKAARKPLFFQHAGQTHDKPAWDSILASFVDVNDTEAAQIVMADNQLAKDGTIKDDIVWQLLSDLPEINTVGMGLTQKDMDDLADRFVVEDIETPDLELDYDSTGDDGERVAPPKFDDTDLGDESEAEDDAPSVSARAASKEEDEDDPEGAGIEITSVDEEIKGAYELKDSAYFDTVGYWQIPKLRSGKHLMQPEDLPESLTTWAGSATKYDDDPDTYWLYNYGVDSTSGMKDISRVIVGFYCVDTLTECLTQRGWLAYDEVEVGDMLFTLNIDTNEAEWKPVDKVHTAPYEGPMLSMQNRSVDALCTPNHRWAVWNNISTESDLYMEQAENLNTRHRIPVARPYTEQVESPYTDAFVELIGWVVTEGTYSKQGHRVGIYQSPVANPGYCKRIEACLDAVGATYGVHRTGTDQTTNCYRFSGQIAETVRATVPDKVLTPEFVSQLNQSQRELLLMTMIEGDGHNAGTNNVQLTTINKQQADAFAMLAAMCGYGTNTVHRTWDGSREFNGYTYDDKKAWIVTVKIPQNASVARMTMDATHYAGTIWCPQTANGTFLARRNGKVYFTGNTYDEYFEPWWYAPSKYVSKLLNSGIEFILTPDFSDDTNAGRAACLHQLYRARWLGRYFQEAGLKVLPNISWPHGDIDYLRDYTLATLPKNLRMIALQMQTYSDKSSDEDKEHVKNEVQLVMDTVKPEVLVLYSGQPGYDFFMDNIKFDGTVKFLLNRQAKLSVVRKGRKKKDTL